MPRRAAALAAFVAATLVVGTVSPGSVAGSDELLGRAPSPTRNGEPKGAGTPEGSQPTGRLIVTYRADVAA
ncbi:MAG: hypothetical protein M3153_11545, partial [Chloroflexota bacterium]|nr:hypothetical protein [Chloroflexota bacterium]